MWFFEFHCSELDFEESVFCFIDYFFGGVFLFVSILPVTYLSLSLCSMGAYLESPSSFDYMQV